MTLRRMEGFDKCASRAELALNRALTFTDAAATGLLYSSTGGRRSGGALYINATSSPDTSLRTCKVPSTPNGGVSSNNNSDMIVGFAFKIKRGTFNVTTGTDSVFLFQAENGAAAEVFNVRLYTASNEWRIGYYTGATLRYSVRFPGASGDEYYPAEDTWYYLEIHVNDFTTTATNTVKINVDGVALGTSGLIISASTGTQTNYIVLNKGVAASSSMASGQEVWWDDLWYGVLTGTYPNGLIGDIRVECLRPTMAGSYDEWSKSSGTSGLALVDDETEDGDTTYIYSDTAGHKFTAKIGAWPNGLTPGDTLHAAQHFAVVKNFSSSTKKITAYYKGPEAEGADAALGDYVYVPGASYVCHFGIPYYWDSTATEPNRAWDAISFAELKDMEFGVTLT